MKPQRNSKEPDEAGSINNVLVLTPAKHMGDFVLSLSAVNALKEFFKGKHFYLVMDSAYTEIIETFKGLENLILYPRNLLSDNTFIKRIIIQAGFLKQLRNTSPDIAIDLHGGVASSTMTFLSGASLRVGRSSAKRAFFYNRKVDMSSGKHKFHSYENIAFAAGVKGSIEACAIRSSEAKKTSLKKTLLEQGISGKKPVVCIHPGAGVIYKQWTEEGFGEIADWLISEGLQVIFVGGNKEIKVTRSIQSIMRNHAYNLAGKLTLGELIALFETSLLYIGNDSGPMHLADATGVPIVALFGHAKEERWGPFSNNSYILEGIDPCEKCKRNDCEYDFRCIRSISPDDVKNAINRIIGSRAEAHGKR